MGFPLHKPYIAYIGEYLYFRYLKCLVTLWLKQNIWRNGNHAEIISQILNVWSIYQHLGSLGVKCRYKYTIHWASGYGKLFVKHQRKKVCRKNWFLPIDLIKGCHHIWICMRSGWKFIIILACFSRGPQQKKTWEVFPRMKKMMSPLFLGIQFVCGIYQRWYEYIWFRWHSPSTGIGPLPRCFFLNHGKIVQQSAAFTSLKACQSSKNLPNSYTHLTSRPLKRYRGLPTRIFQGPG